MSAPELGLCASCIHLKIVPARRSNTFYQCILHAEVNYLKKYPYLPVEQCTYHNKQSPAVEPR